MFFKDEAKNWRFLLCLSLIYVVIIPFVLTYVQSNLSAFVVIFSGSNSGLSLLDLIFLSFVVVFAVALINHSENRQENKIVRNIALFSLFYLIAIIIPFLLSVSVSATLPSQVQLNQTHENCGGNNQIGYACILPPQTTVITSLDSDLIVIFSIILIVFQIFEDKFTRIDFSDRLNNVFLLLPLLGISLAIGSKEFLVYGSQINTITSFADISLLIGFIIFGFAMGLLDSSSERLTIKFDIKQNTSHSTNVAGKIYPYKFGSDYVTNFFYVPKGYKYKLKDIKPKNSEKSMPKGKLIFHKNLHLEPHIRIWTGSEPFLISHLFDKQRKMKISQEEFDEGECFDVQFVPENTTQKSILVKIELEFYVKKLKIE